MRKLTYFYSLLLTALFLLPWSGMKAETLDAGAGSASDEYLPIYGYYADNNQHNQYIIPASELESMQNGTITGMKFYTSAGYSDPTWNSGSAPTVTFKLAEVGTTTLSALLDVELTQVWSGTVAVSSGEWNITFGSSYTYGDGNLLVDVTVSANGYTHIYFVGESLTNAAYWTYGSTAKSKRSFIPKTTFTYTPGAAPSCPKTGTPEASEVEATTATISWTAGGTESAWNLQYKKASDEEWTSVNGLTTNSYNLTGLSAGKVSYNYQVQADCGGGDKSGWKAGVPFQTDCGLIATLPWNSDDVFAAAATTNSMPSCWEELHTTGYDAPYVVSTTSNLRFYGNSNKTNNSRRAIVILPKFTTDIKNLKVKITYSTGSTGDGYPGFQIGYIKADEVSDASKFHALTSTSSPYKTTSTSTFSTSDFVNLSEAATGSHIAICFTNSTTTSTSSSVTSRYGYIKKIEVESAQDCSAPTVSSFEQLSLTSARITWEAKAGVPTYQYCVVAKGADPDWSGNLTVDNTNTVDITSGISVGYEYDFYVKCVCGGDPSAAYTFSLVSCPVVTDVTLDGGTYKSVTVNWTTGSATNCDVRYSADGGSSWTTAETNTSATSKTITGLSVGTEYTFQVKPNCSADGWVAAGETYTPAFTVPVPSASGITDAQATVSWSALLDNPNYKYIRVAAGSTAPDAAAWAAAASTASTSVTLTGLTGGAGYDVYVRAVYAGGEGEPAMVNFTTGKIAPTDLVQGATTTSSIAISWSYAGAATQFQWRSSKSGSDWSSPISVTNAVETGLSDGETYTFDVRAYYADGIYSSLLTGSFNTACAAKSLPYSCGFENSDADPFANNGYNTCWKKIGSPATTTTSAYVHTGSKGLRIGGTEEQYAILPEFADAVKGMQITFWYKNYFPTSYASTLVLGSMTDPTDKTTFTTIKTLDVNGSFVQIVEQSLASAGASDHYIAFKYTGSNQYSAVALDDISVTVLPSCPKPTGVTADPSTTSASISWTYGGSETAWKLQYSTDGSNWTDANGGADITTNPYTLTGLTANKTTYYARVKAVCGGSDVSDWSDASDPFQTECAAITIDADHEWNCDFEDAVYTTGFAKDKTPGCWDILNANLNTSTTYPVIYVNNASGYYQGTKALFFRSNTSYGYAILPVFDADLSTMQITFKHKEESGTGSIVLGYLTNINDASTFVSIKSCISSSNWTTETNVKLSSVPSGARLAFRHQGASPYYDAAVDDITINVVPSCAIPTAVIAGAKTTTTVSISWTDESASSWKLQYSTDGTNWIDANNGNAVTKPYVLGETNETLTENTLYYARVKAICGVSSESGWSTPSEGFRTECEDKTVTELVAWEENFDNGHSVGEMPFCWAMPAANTNYEYAKVDNSHGENGSNCLDIQVNSTYSKIILLPEFTEEVKNLMISFDYNNGSTSSNYGPLEVGYFISGNFYSLRVLNRVENYTASGEIEIPQVTPTGSRIAFRVVGSKSGSSYYSHSYIDNITVSLKPSCPAPTGLAAVATSDGANVSWTDDNASEWKLQYSIKDADSWTEVTGISATNHTLTGLSTANTYEVQVKAVCGVGSESAWTASAEFQPVCNAPTALAVTARTQNSATFSWTSTESAWRLQYKAEGDTDWSEENVAANPFTLTGLTAGTTYQAKIQSACGSAFTDAVSFTTWCDSKLSLPVNETNFSAVPACWEESPAGAIQIAESKLCFVGEGERFLYLPQSDINLNLLSVTLTFGGSLELGYISEPNGAFTSLVAAPESGTEYDLASLAPAAAKYLAIRYNGASSLSQSTISAVNIRRTPGCNKPTGLAASNETTVGADIEWTENGSASAWQIQCKLASVASWDGVAINDVTEHPYTLTGLAQGTNYSVRVRANCGEGDENKSDWSDEASFTTSCAALAALPFVENFDAALSGCWDVTDQNTSVYPHSVFNGELLLPSGKTGAGHLVKLPEISADLSNASMTLRYKCDVGASYAQPQVGYMDGLNFVEIDKLGRSNTYKETRVPVGAANGHRLAIRYADGASEGNGMSIDQIRVVPTITFVDDNNVDNQARLNAVNDQTMDVLIVRPFWRAGYYNTICLPFNLSASQLAEATCSLNSFTIKEYDHSDVDASNDVVDIYLKQVSALQAGKAYFAMYDGSATDLDTLEFRDVTIDATVPNEVSDANLELHGIYNPFELTAGDKTTLYLSKNNKLYYASKAGYIKGFRAYFSVEDGSPMAAAIRRGAPIYIRDGHGTPTGVESPMTNDKLQIRKVLENNQVVIIRNGVKYTIQGQVISK